MTFPPVEVVLPAGGTIDSLVAERNLLPFGPLQMSFAAALSRALTGAPELRAYPELVALGFWLRPANLQRIVTTFSRRHAGAIHLPRGLVFHVAPSNVDTIFVYSWFVSLLCGNRNLIRLSSRQGAQTQALLTIIGRLLAEDAWRGIAARTLVIRYGHDATVSAALSSACDVRVIWGGDATIDTFRAFALRPSATELAFANKFSLAVLQAGAVAAASAEDLAQLATAFHNDVYWFGQMACSSPRMVLWLGSRADVEVAQQHFWPALQRELDERGDVISPAEHMNKEVSSDALAIEQRSVRILTPDPRITRIAMQTPLIDHMLHCGAGLFYEARIEALDELLPLLSRRIQTISHHGVPLDDWSRFLTGSLPAGIDRIVPLGRALDFEPVWDGQDLLAAFLREVSLR